MVWSFLLEPLISCSYFKMYGPYGGFLYVEWNLGNFRPSFYPNTSLQFCVLLVPNDPINSIRHSSSIFVIQFFDNMKNSLFNSLRYEKNQKKACPLSLYPSKGLLVSPRVKNLSCLSSFTVRYCECLLNHHT